jgi:endonuclease/exonuclease/phosphatase (EEP) superfamily protein YafD
MTRFRLMTANVLEDSADHAALAALIDRVDPDIVFLQEMTAGPADVLASKFECHFLFPSAEFEGRGVATKFDAECGSVEIPWRPGTYAVFELDGREVVTGGFHMSNPIQFPWWRSVEERKDQVAAVIEWGRAQHSDALVLAGDFNATPIWPLYKRLVADWDDLPAELAATEGREPDLTWAWRPGWPRMLRIDHVFGRGVRAITSTVEPVQGSDHHALVVDVELNTTR